MTDDLPRLRALRDALRKTASIDGEILHVTGGGVSVKLVMSAPTWALLAWAVSDSPEGLELEPLRRSLEQRSEANV